MSNTAALNQIKAWMISLRLRTTLLALASIVTGSAIAAACRDNSGRWWHCWRHTASMLKILSDLTNDYGDVVKDSDDCSWIGPLRGMQLGLISRASR